ncbi:MAG: F0F1 ATP synthase subunit gamma [Bacteroidaceae bacterium]|nr:F0F1 ATP synthase subunit gamma [Bacteroidaceae bacterium]
MASLKEVKNRINSVTSTRKITSAMKLVASSKLHRAQGAIESMLPYEEQLNGMMARFISELHDTVSSPYTEQRKIEHAVVIAISSNSSLCGAFNANVIKEMTKVLDELRQEGISQIDLIPVGVKVGEKVKKLGFTFESNCSSLLDNPNYAEASKIASGLMKRFANKEIDKVVLIYNHFKNTSTQILMDEVFLPIDLSAIKKNSDSMKSLDYIIEPSQEEIVSELIPKVLHLKIYTAILDSLASEHAARVMAMQIATDNADDILNELTLMYNKTRQAAITSELLDIVGASFQ